MINKWAIIRTKNFFCTKLYSKTKLASSTVPGTGADTYKFSFFQQFQQGLKLESFTFKIIFSHIPPVEGDRGGGGGVFYIPVPLPVDLCPRLGFFKAPVLRIRNDFFRIRIQLWIFRVPDPDPGKSAGSGKNFVKKTYIFFVLSNI